MCRKDFPRRAEIIRARLALICDLGRGLKFIQSGWPHYAAELRPCVDTIKRNLNRDYLAWSIEDPLKVSFAGRGVHRHNVKRRTRMAIGRYFMRKLGYKNSQVILETFLNTVLSKRPVGKYEFLKGEDIRDAYRNEIGGHSCMTGDYADDRLDLYVKNTDKVSLMIYRDGNVTARALLWKTDCDRIALDRIYPNSGYHVNIIHDYAAKQGWLCREHNRLPSSEVRFGGRCLRVTVDSAGAWPYLDSFQWSNDDPNRSRVVLNTAGSGGTCFDDTEGGYEGGENCTDCNCSVDRDDAYYHRDNTYCHACFHDSFSYCRRCDYTFENDDGFFIDDEPYCEHCACRISSVCERCGDRVRNEDINQVEDGGYDWCDLCCERHAHWCGECGAWNIEPCECTLDDESKELEHETV